MDIFINGHKETSLPCTIAELVAIKESSPENLVVELNGTIVKQEKWSTIELKDNDTLELLSFVGGG